MYIALISLIVLACVLLVLVVLAQNSKGGGLSSQFGGAGTSQLMGVKRTGDLLEKLTWSFAVPSQTDQKVRFPDNFSNLSGIT